MKLTIDPKKDIGTTNTPSEEQSNATRNNAEEEEQQLETR